MSNKAKRNISLFMMVISIAIFIGLVISRSLFGIQHETWQYFAAPLCFCFFGVLYRNFSFAVREDKKYGQIK